ncbi:MAG: hypothetical protein ACI9FZ_000970 [Bacteroidia bacterium]|jgi:hypothetical protein
MFDARLSSASAGDPGIDPPHDRRIFHQCAELSRAATIAKLIAAEAAFPFVPADFTEGRSAERRGVWGVAAK